MTAMNPLNPFDFEGRALRLATDAAGNPWFHAGDVCAALELGNPRDAVARHVDPDDVGKHDAIDAVGRTQQVNFVNESGLYALIFGSTKEAAKRFKRWVTSEVLPALRRTGSYAMPAAEPEPPALPAAPSHRADTVVSATRSLTALVKAGLALGLPRRAAAHRANAQTLQLTGLDLADMLDVDLSTPCEDKARPLGRALSVGVAEFLEEWRGGRWPMVPALATDVHAAYLRFCQAQGHAALPIGAFAVQLRRGGAESARKRWFAEGSLRGPHSVQWPGAITTAPDGQAEAAWLGEGIGLFRNHLVEAR